MAETTPEKARKIAPPRNDLNRHGLHRNSQALRLQGQNPDFIYKCFSTDPKHPSYVGKKLSEHEVGSQLGGYALAPGWQPVNSLVDSAKFANPRDDQGKGVDTVQRYGTQVLCRMKREDYEATYGKAEGAYQEEIERQFYKAETAKFRESADGIRGDASIKAVVSREADADVNELLKQ